MLRLSPRRCNDAKGMFGATADAVVAGIAVIALSAVLAGCTATENPKLDSEPSGVTSVTTDWQAPEDPTAQGPTEAPPLEEVQGDLDDPIALPTGVSVRVDSVETTTITPQTPGETAGSAVIVSLTVENTSDSEQNVDSAVVMLVADDGEIGIATTAGPNDPLRGEVAPGGEVSGSYVYMLEPAQGRVVTVSVNYAAGEPVALFNGTIP